MQYNINIIIVMKKKQFEKGWSQLSFRYKQWEDLQAKGKMKMKKKRNKEGKQYYDFDFSRYQYYYSYPTNYVGLASPSDQKQFINSIIEKTCQNPSNFLINTQYTRWQELDNILRPLQLHQFLRDMDVELNEKVSSLRIQKVLRIKKMKGLFGKDNQIQKQMIQLIEAQIRSLVHKKIRIDNKLCKVGPPIDERLKDMKSFLKQKTIDEYYFTDLTKGDIAVLMRIRHVKQALSFNSHILTKIITNVFQRENAKFKRKYLQKRAQKTFNRKKQIILLKQKLYDKVNMKVNEHRPTFFDQNNEGKLKLQTLIESLDYIKCIQQNIQQNQYQKISNKNYNTLKINYDQVTYIPFDYSELKSRLVDKVSYYFNKTLIDQEVLNGSEEHISYKINNLCFLQLKVLWESYNYSNKKQESSLIKIKSMMKKQLELVYSHHIKNLLNIRQHSIKASASQRWQRGLLFKYTPQNQKQSIMQYQIKLENRFKDPTICSFINLFGVNKDTTVRQLIQKYVQKSLQKSTNLYENLILYYKNSSGDEKTHIVNVLNKNISIMKQEQDPTIRYFIQFLQKKETNQIIGFDLLRSYYMLVYTRCTQMRYQVMQILNGQIMCLIKAQNRMKLLWNKSKIPFQLSKQFLDRFIQCSEADGFKFVSAEQSQSHIDGIFKQMHNQDADKDYLNWKAQIGIQVRRKRSDNPLLQGKSIIFQQSYQLLQQCLTRVEFLCSETIRMRETFLHQTQLAQIVDRLQILLQFLTYEKKFQQTKLKLLDLYTDQLLRTSSSRGIIIIYQQINKVFHYNNIVDLTQAHFAQCYKVQTSCFESKVNILKLLTSKQQKFQLQFGLKQFNEFRQANFSLTLPQISSIYYTEQIAVQHENKIIQQEAKQKETDSIASDNESQLNNNRPQTGQNSSLPEGSQYHLRTSFQEVLTKNSIKSIQDDNNKKQQLMNKKKQRTLNDTILGTILPRSKILKSGSDFFYYSYFAIQIMRKIDQILCNCFVSPEIYIKDQFLKQVAIIIENYTFEQYKNLIRPQQLTICLNNTHKMINKFLQKTKNQGGLSNRGSSQHWLCINSKIIQNIISCQTGEQIDQLRGLYICLNAMHLNQVNFKLKQIQHLQKSRFSQYKYFSYVTENFSSDQIDKKQLLIQSPGYFQKRNICFLKLFSDIKQMGQQHFLPIGNYNMYFKAISAFQFAVHNLISSFNDIFSFILQDFQCIQSQLMVMEKYQCCQSLFNLMSIIPGIDNRILLRKKLQFMATLKKTIIPKQLSIQIAEVLDSCCRHIPKFRKLDVRMSLNSIVNLVSQFQSYINQIIKSSIFINMIAQELKAQKKQKKDIRKLKKLSTLLPFVDKHLTIQLLPSINLANTFVQHREIILAFQTKSIISQQTKVTVTQEKFSVQRILDYVLGSGQTILRFIRQQYLKRKKEQITGDSKKFQYQKYLDRHFPSFNNQNQTQLQIKLHPQLRDTQKYKKIRMFRRWMQCQFLIFGCGLTPQQLAQFRKMLINPQMIFHVFWDNNLKNIIGSRQLSKLRTQCLDSKNIIINYKNQYLTYMHLKKIYKNFVEDLSDYQFQQQISDCILVLFTCAPKFFNPQTQDWGFLTNFCDPFLQKINTKVDILCNYMNKLNSPFGYEKSRLFNYSNKQTKFNISSLKYYLWSSENKNKIAKIDSIRRYIKQKLTETKSLAVRAIKDQVIMPYYRNQRLISILSYIGTDVNQYQLDLEDYRVHFEKYVHEGFAILNPKELFIFNMTERNMQLKGQLVKTKDQVMKIVMNNQYYMKLLRQKFYKYCTDIIQNELSLRKILIQDMKNQQSCKDHIVFKQTVNKILVPKVKLNPFLSSPLRIQNHFFAGTIKLSFVDQFLNKLRNRAVMIELAQGGSGYLLKVNQLDQSVDVLCRSIVGFSQKQFTDRFRTIYDALQQAIQRNFQLKQENNNYKAILKCVKEFQNKQIKSLLYQKLNDYIIGFYQNQKSYQIIVNLLKTLENKMEKQINKKYISKIAQLQNTIKQLNQRLDNLRSDCSQIVKCNTNQVKDALFNGFKQRAQRILNKHFIQDIKSGKNHQEVQSQDSQILLKKLMMQKSFYQLKIAKIQGNLSTKIGNLERKILQQSKLQNLLLMEQQKNKTLVQQVKQLQKCSIQNELLKKQMSRKQEQQTTSKFRLVKVNQSLKGKLKRMQEEIQQQKIASNNKIQQLFKSQQKNRTHFSVQVSNEENKVKRKTFHIRTESSSLHNNIYDIGLWKQKWIKSQRRSQAVLQGVRKAYEHFVFTKNANKLCQKLKEIISQYQSRRSERIEKT